MQSETYHDFFCSVGELEDELEDELEAEESEESEDELGLGDGAAAAGGFVFAPVSVPPELQ